MDLPDFEEFSKIARLSRDCVVTEKIDGTNAQVMITEDGKVYAGSRTRWLAPGADNFGFAGWVEENREALLKLGPGRHFGEWWGKGIQRGYGLNERRFSLLNVARWADDSETPRPACCHVVPVLYRGPFITAEIDALIERLATFGSMAAIGFSKPEGVIVWHEAARVLFKKTILKDEQPKGKL